MKECAGQNCVYRTFLAAAGFLGAAYDVSNVLQTQCYSLLLFRTFLAGVFFLGAACNDDPEQCAVCICCCLLAPFWLQASSHPWAWRA